MGILRYAGGNPNMTKPTGGNIPKPIDGTLASELAVGSTVKLMETDIVAEYLVVHQGLPSSMYDASCNGTWLLRKDIHEMRQWHGSEVNDYENSTIHSYLNNTFIGLLDANTQSAIKQVKLPYRKGSGYGTTITSGANGLAAKIFLLSGAELNWGSGVHHCILDDGACLSYFSGCDGIDSKRIAYLNGSATDWCTRSPDCEPYFGSKMVLIALINGGFNGYGCAGSWGIRPALVLQPTALFDKTTLILKGVAA